MNQTAQKKLNRFFFILGGAIFGSITIFFVLGTLLITLLGGPIPSGSFGTAFLLFSFAVGPIIGGFIGYFIFKKTRYSNPELYSSYK